MYIIFQGEPPAQINKCEIATKNTVIHINTASTSVTAPIPQEVTPSTQSLIVSFIICNNEICNNV